MISLVVAAVLLLIHALVCLMLWTLMKLGLLPVRGHMLAVIVLVPLWGPLLVVLLSVCSAVFGEGLKGSALESLRFNDDLHRSMSVPSGEDDSGVVPLEEALIVNDPAYRRRLMLSMLTEEPDAYLAQLQAAKLNDDVEVAHYAATGRRPDERGATYPRPCRALSLDGTPRGVGGLYCHGRCAAGGACRRAVQRGPA